MTDFEDYETTIKIEAALTTIVKRELANLKPPTRMAQVASIDRENRRVNVVFTGEVEEVTVPYLGTAPAEVGQFVRIGGTTHDRYVEDVAGEAESEARIKVLESELQRRTLRCYANAGPQADFNLQASRTIPNNTAALSGGNGIPSVKNVTVDANGIFQVAVTGMYQYAAHLMLEALRGNNAYMWVRIRLANGSEFDHGRSRIGQLLGSNEYIETAPMVLTGLVYLNAGDSIYMTGYSDNTGEVNAQGTSLSINLVDPT